MSRSYKHTPRAGQQKSRWYKRHFNRLVRREQQVAPNSGYRKIRPYMQYAICDFENVGTTCCRYAELRGRWTQEVEQTELENDYKRDYLRK